MKIVQKFQTIDGIVHDGRQQAEKHLDQVSGLILTKLAHDLVKLDGKYQSVIDFLEENRQRLIDDFAKIKKYDDDLKVTDEFDDEKDW